MDQSTSGGSSPVGTLSAGQQKRKAAKAAQRHAQAQINDYNIKLQARKEAAFETGRQLLKFVVYSSYYAPILC